MTFRGSRGFGLAFTLVAICSVALVGMQFAADDVEATTTYIEGGWEIVNETVTLRDETVIVTGNVTVDEGGTLVLLNSTLRLNLSYQGQGILVDRGGTLRSTDSKIFGSHVGSTFTVRNDTLLEGCTIDGFSGLSNVTGITLEDGMVEFRHCNIRSEIDAWTDILFVNVTVRDGTRLYYNHPGISRDLEWVIRDLDKASSGSVIEIEPSNGSVRNVQALIENLIFRKLRYGLSIMLDRGLDITVSNCEFIQTPAGIALSEMNGGTANFINNSIVCDDVSVYYSGFSIQVTGRSHLSFAGNTVEGVRNAYYLYTREGPDLDFSIGNLAANNCRYSIAVLSEYQGALPHFHVTVHNSTFERMLNGFTVGYGASLSIYDTEHQLGVGIVSEDGLYIRAYTRLDISSVRWRDGDQIPSGRLDLLGDDGAIVTSMDIGRPEPIVMLGWEIMPSSWCVREVLTPSIIRAGRRFNATGMDPWGAMPVAVEIIDDLAPTLTIEVPSFGHYHNRDALNAIGTCTEVGSGLADLTYSLDGSAPEGIDDPVEGRWSLPLSDLLDGEHVLSVYAADKVGNEAESVMVIFNIDSVAPFLELNDPPHSVNTSELMVSGRTEPGSSLVVNGVEHHITADGSFKFTLFLREGLNHFSVVAEDRAGNHNMTDFKVHLDSTPPYLLVESPWNGSWITSWEVLVKGETEPGAHLVIEGEEVVLLRGAFEHVVDLPFGEYHLHIDVRDAAGNSYHRVIVLFADWEPPRITIESPNRTTVHTNEDTVFILGTAEDEYLDVVMINGEVVPAPEGTFLKECDLEMGCNVFEVSVTDMAGNGNSVTFTIIMDVEHPECSCELRAVDGELIPIGHRFISSTPQVRMSIQASEPVFVTVAQRRFGPSARMLIDLDLEEGANNIVVVVSDRAGNEAIPYEYDVTVDTIPPKLTVTTSVTGPKTEGDSITLYGYTEAGVGLTIDGVRRSVKHDGTFEEDLPLEVGVNVFEVTVTDLAGNTNSTTVTIERVEPAPDYRTGLVGLGLVLISAAVILLLVVMPFLRRRQEKKVT